MKTQLTAAPGVFSPLLKPLQRVSCREDSALVLSHTRPWEPGPSGLQGRTQQAGSELVPGTEEEESSRTLGDPSLGE